MRFVRENRQITTKSLYCEDVLQMLFADSDSEGNICFWEWCAMVLRAWRECSQAQTSDHFGLFPTGDGGGRGGLSVHRRGSALLRSHQIAPSF